MSEGLCDYCHTNLFGGLCDCEPMDRGVERVPRDEQKAEHVGSYSPEQVHTELSWAMPVGPSGRRNAERLRYIAALANRAAYLMEQSLADLMEGSDDET